MNIETQSSIILHQPLVVVITAMSTDVFLIAWFSRSDLALCLDMQHSTCGRYSLDTVKFFIVRLADSEAAIVQNGLLFVDQDLTAAEF